MIALDVLRVFVDDQGAHGNPLGVVLDGGAVPVGARQRIAGELGYSETVFVDDASAGIIRIFTPRAELPFAGHPTVGTAWLLAEVGRPVLTLRPPAGEVGVRAQGDLTFVVGRPEWVNPPYDFVQLGSPAEVEALTGPPAGMDQVAVWAWEDEAGGGVRSRVFPVSIGIPEDEATGAAAIQLASMLARPLLIRQGRGSILRARPVEGGRAEVGGRTVMVETRTLPE